MHEPRDLVREVLESHHQEAYKWAMSCCDYEPDRARDVMQSVYAAILEGKAVFRGESSLRTWLFAVIRRIAWREARRAGRGAGALAGLASLMADESGCGEADAAEAAERAKLVAAALGGLSGRQRQVIELVYYRGFTLEEAAVVLGMRTGSARTHFHRAKRALAARLDNLRD